MTAKLIPIENLPGDNREEIGKLLDNIREKVDAGEISSIAVGIVYKDGNTGDCWSFLTSISLQIAALERLKHKLLMDGL